MASRYQIRQIALASIGFSSYDEYLRSDLWLSIRTRILDRDGKCRSCGNPAYTAHHITYSEAVLRGDDDSQLVAICRGCHKHTEFDGDEKLKSTTKIAAKLAKRAIRNLGGRDSKKLRKQTQPRCRCCQKQFKALGRNDICMNCYRSGKAITFLEQAFSETKRDPSHDHIAHDGRNSVPREIVESATETG